LEEGYSRVGGDDHREDFVGESHKRSFAVPPVTLSKYEDDDRDSFLRFGGAHLMTAVKMNEISLYSVHAWEQAVNAFSNKLNCSFHSKWATQHTERKYLLKAFTVSLL